MSKKRLFYKSIIWQLIGLIWISLLSYLWFGDWIRSLSFSMVVLIVSIFIYVLYEMAWERFTNNKWNGAPARIRTADLLITNQLLYQLSYKGTFSTKALYKMYLLNSIHLKQIMKLNNEELIVRFKL